MPTSQASQARRPSHLLQSIPLPALPDCAVRMLSLIGDEDDAIDRAVSLIEADAGMTSQLLKFGNSSYFGFRHEIATVRQATALLGFRKVRNFVVWNAVFGALTGPKGGSFSMTRFRADSLRRGVFARELAKALKLGDPEEAFTAALLQDVAVPLLVRRLGDEYVALLEDADGDDQRLRELEQETLGWTHADAAAWLFKRWKLPKSLVAMITALAEGGHADEAGAVRASTLLPSFGRNEWPDVERFQMTLARLDSAGKLDADDLLAKVDDTFGGLAKVLNVGSAGQPLTALYEAAADGVTA